MLCHYLLVRTYYSVTLIHASKFIVSLPVFVYQYKWEVHLLIFQMLNILEDIVDVLFIPRLLLCCIPPYALLTQFLPTLKF